MRRLVNLPAVCDDYTPPCVSDNTSTVEIGDTGPDGEAGADGARGTDGRNAFTQTTSAFKMPVEGALAAVQVTSNAGFTVGQRVFIDSVGYFEISSLVGTTQINLENLGGTSALPAGALIGSGLKLTSGGQPGVTAEANAPKRFAYLAQKEDMGTDGGPMDFQFGVGVNAQGFGVVKHLEEISNIYGVVQISGADNERIRLLPGSWKIKVRTPSYYSKAFRMMVRERSPDDLAAGSGVLLTHGQGYSSQLANSIGRQTSAEAHGLVAVSDPNKWIEISLWQESWSFARGATLRNRAFGVAANFDDGAAVAVDEIYTLIEIEEL